MMATSCASSSHVVLVGVGAVAQEAGVAVAPAVVVVATEAVDTDAVNVGEAAEVVAERTEEAAVEAVEIVRAPNGPSTVCW